MGPTGNTASVASQLDVVIDGTWVLVPWVDSERRIVRVDIYSPGCGHPLGVYFTNQLNPNPWPATNAFYQLDPHGYAISIERGSRPAAGMPLSGIDRSINHCVEIARPIGSNWDLMLSISAGPDKWLSSDTIDPQTTDKRGNTVNCFSGKDAPKGKISSMQTLSFTGVTAVGLHGAPARAQGLLPEPWSGDGTMIFEDEIPYIPTLQHERAAIFAMANLAGLDLALEYPLPPKRAAVSAPEDPRRQGLHTGTQCGHSLLVFP
ncbi:MAG TPA: hypothetical protein VK716_17560 [Terracidiphilus sp.]|jgi:hypothetical protein|nr:hypothetical protein [Terracidiphilus sp.]